MTTLKFYRYFLNATQEEKEKLADYAYELARDAFEGIEMSESALKVEGMEFFVHHIKEDLNLEEMNDLLCKVTGSRKSFIVKEN